MSRKYLPAPPLPAGYGLPLGFVAGIVAIVLGVATGATGDPVRSLILLAATVAALAACTTPVAALGIAVLCWGLHDGFVLGRGGDLVATPSAAMAAAVLVLTALIVAGVATAIRVAMSFGRTFGLHGRN